jgi:hypothetical protein
LTLRCRVKTKRAEEIRRRDAALEREQQLAAIFADRLRELEAPASSEARESPQPANEEPERADPHSATVESEEPVQRPWWWRVFGRGTE